METMVNGTIGVLVDDRRPGFFTAFNIRCHPGVAGARFPNWCPSISIYRKVAL